MFLLTVLCIMFVLFVVLAAVILGVGGTVFTLAFADILVCIFVIGIVIKLLSKKE